MNKIIIGFVIVAVIIGGAFFLLHKTAPQCSDGKDNDGDTLIDYGTATSSDPGCTDANDNDESNDNSGAQSGNTNAPTGGANAGGSVAAKPGEVSLENNTVIERRQVFVAGLPGKTAADLDTWFTSFDVSSAKSTWVSDELFFVGTDKVKDVFFTNGGLNILKVGLTGQLDAPATSKPKVNSVTYYDLSGDTNTATRCEPECSTRTGGTPILDLLLKDSKEFQKNLQDQASASYGPKPFGTKDVLGQMSTCYRAEFTGKLVIYTCVNNKNIVTLSYTATFDKTTGKIASGSMGSNSIVHINYGFSPLPSGVSFTPATVGASELALFQL